MTDKVQLIKQELERIEQILDDFNKTNNNTIDNGIVSAKKNICKHIKSFIDSLPEEPVSKDLEEASIAYSCANPSERSNGMYDQTDIEWAFEAGAEWQKQQMKEALQTEYEKGRFDMREEMMKDAMDGEYWDGSIYLDNRPTEYKDGENVKIIIVNKEQQ